MKIFQFLALFSVALIFSCSRVNVESRDYYRQKNFRHGIVPLSTTASNKFKEASLARGKDLYVRHCLSCHGDKGLGDGPQAANLDSRPANLKKLVKEVPNFLFFMSISQWQGDMPGWTEQFNEADREDLVAYIKTFK